MPIALNDMPKSWFYATATAVVALNIAAFLSQNYYLLLIPLALWLVYFVLFSMEKLLFFAIFCLPLSFIYDTELGVSFALPTEPILFGLMLAFWAKVLIEGNYNRQILRHPITIAILIHILAMCFSAITSTMPEVSFKFILVNVWFITCFYFLLVLVFKQGLNRIQYFFWLYIIPFTAVILYASVQHIQAGLTQKATGWVTQPFVLDHGVYGAMLGLIIPFLVVFLFYARHFTNKPLVGVLVFGVLLLCLFALIFSYTRAAWLGVVCALGFYFLMLLRVKFITFLAGLSLGLIIFAVFQTQIVMDLNRNKTDSSTDFDKHLKSISNVRTDASNLERLNRWASGWRMFKEKPLLGWGVGTYQFQYAPFQKPYEKTIISTNMHDVGGIHSEYFAPAVENGTVGFLAFLGVVLCSIACGMRAFYRSTSMPAKLLALSAVLGLITYFVHGTLNNYLDSDKTAPLVWGFMAIITSVELFFTPKTDLK